MVIASVAQQGLWASVTGRRRRPSSARAKGRRDKMINRGTAIAYDPAKPDTFWESGIYNGGGAYRTDRNGRTFRQLGDVGHAEGPSALASPTQTARPCSTGTHEQHKRPPLHRRRSDLGGHLRQRCPRTSDSRCIRSCLKDRFPRTLLGTKQGANSGIFRTTDAGATRGTGVPWGGERACPSLAQADDSIYWVLETSPGGGRRRRRGRRRPPGAR